MTILYEQLKLIEIVEDMIERCINKHGLILKIQPNSIFEQK